MKSLIVFKDKTESIHLKQTKKGLLLYIFFKNLCNWFLRIVFSFWHDLGFCLCKALRDSFTAKAYIYINIYINKTWSNRCCSHFYYYLFILSQMIVLQVCKGAISPSFFFSNISVLNFPIYPISCFYCFKVKLFFLALNFSLTCIILLQRRV